MEKSVLEHLGGFLELRRGFELIKNMFSVTKDVPPHQSKLVKALPISDDFVDGEEEIEVGPKELIERTKLESILAVQSLLKFILQQIDHFRLLVFRIIGRKHQVSESFYRDDDALLANFHCLRLTLRDHDSIL